MRNAAMALLGTAALAAAAVAGAAQCALADGALAIGTTGDVVKDGIAFGMVVDEPKENAAETAIRRCRTFQARAVADRCKLVATFAGECFAVAYDPQPGTPGAGWGIGPDQLAANLNAIAMCEQTAGPARRGYCQVESAGCDTTGQREAPKAAPQEPAKTPPRDASQAPAGTGAKEPVKDNAMTATVKAAPPASMAPPPEASRAPARKAPAKAEDMRRTSWFGAGSPLLPVGAMAAVGLAYGLGRIVKGKLREGLGDRQAVVGGGLAVVSGVIVKALDMAGSEQSVMVAIAALIALAAAVFA